MKHREMVVTMDKLSNRWMFYCGLLAGMGVTVDDLKYIQDLIDAEEEGLILRLPCKVGDTVYSVVKDGLQIFELEFSLDFYVRRKSDFGKTVFLTKEEAEQKLAEMKGK